MFAQCCLADVGQPGVPEAAILEPVCIAGAADPFSAAYFPKYAGADSIQTHFTVQASQTVQLKGRDTST